MLQFSTKSKTLLYDSSTALEVPFLHNQGSMTQPSAVPLLAECVNSYSWSSRRHFLYFILILNCFLLQKGIYPSSKLYERPATFIIAFSALK